MHGPIGQEPGKLLPRKNCLKTLIKLNSKKVFLESEFFMNPTRLNKIIQIETGIKAKI